jgi:uncharacterized protein involved in exopolysaccharide biosynthesis
MPDRESTQLGELLRVEIRTVQDVFHVHVSHLEKRLDALAAQLAEMKRILANTPPHPDPQ